MNAHGDRLLLSWILGYFSKGKLREVLLPGLARFELGLI
jgi:hypothetical protein